MEDLTKRIVLATSVASLLLAAVGCSNKDKTTGPGDQNTASTVWNDVGQFWVTSIDATSQQKYAYYSFTTRDVVDITDAEAAASAEWHLALKRVNILTNGGLAGPGDVEGADLFLAGIETDTLGFANVTANDVAQLPASAWKASGYKRAISIFDPITRNPNQWVFAMKDAEGKYYKFQIPQIIGGGAPPMMGQIVFRYVYAPSGTDLSGPVDVDTVRPTADTLYYDFSTKTASFNLADPANRTDWDIRLYHYTVDMNNTVFGIGQAGGVPIHLIPGYLQVDPTDFEAYLQASTEPITYQNDGIASVFGLQGDWYNYLPEQGHLILSKKHTYAIRTGGKIYKLYILTYRGETGVPGNYIIHWAEL